MAWEAEVPGAAPGLAGGAEWPRVTSCGAGRSGRGGALAAGNRFVLQTQLMRASGVDFRDAIKRVDTAHEVTAACIPVSDATGRGEGQAAARGGRRAASRSPRVSSGGRVAAWGDARRGEPRDAGRRRRGREGRGGGRPCVAPSAPNPLSGCLWPRRAPASPSAPRTPLPTPGAASLSRSLLGLRSPAAPRHSEVVAVFSVVLDFPCAF